MRRIITVLALTASLATPALARDRWQGFAMSHRDHYAYGRHGFIYVEPRAQPLVLDGPAQGDPEVALAKARADIRECRPVVVHSLDAFQPGAFVHPASECRQ